MQPFPGLVSKPFLFVQNAQAVPLGFEIFERIGHPIDVMSCPNDSLDGDMGRQKALRAGGTGGGGTGDCRAERG
jgi:hypothetical protein